MTRITGGFYDDRFYLEVSGHACEERDGVYEMPSANREDESALACAAVSILVLTAAEKIARLDSEGAFYNAGITVESGYCCFDLETRDEYSDTLSSLLDTLIVGFELLEENYPDLVSVQ
ncbi:MAG: ribosomal-processing cysteine protease Prp [Ruminococcaceae bacterium]|nr:ribosomal-processing cysteine protease Prp [Oscillospiraceae bacterium]